MKRALGACLAAVVLFALPACQPKQKEIDIPAEIARNLKDGDANLRNFKLDEAEANYNNVIGYDANNAEAMRGLGRLALERKDPTTAIEWLEKAIAANGDSAFTRASLGRAYVANKNWAKAAEHLGKAWELDQETEQYGLEYGVALRETKAYDKASEVLNEVAEINPMLQYVYRELGKTQFEAGELDKALLTFMKAQTKWAGDQDSFAGAGMVYEAKGEISKSIDQWAQYIEQDCCSTYSKEIAQPKLAELKAKENAMPNDGGDPPTEG